MSMESQDGGRQAPENRDVRKKDAVDAPGARVLMLLQNTCYPKDYRVRREAKALVAAGYRVTVISPKTPEQSWHEVLDGVRVYRYPRFPSASGFLGYLGEYGYSMAMTFFLSLLVLVQRGFDVVHAHCPPDAFVGIAAFYKLLGKRFVYDHHDLSPELYHARFGGTGNRTVFGALLFLEKLSCRLADHVIATNESYKAVDMERGRVPAERITIVRNGPDLDGANPAKNASDLRPAGKSVLCYVGIIGTQDGVDFLLRALHHLLHDLGRTDFVCYILGKGEAVPGLKALKEELSLSDWVTFTGWQSRAGVDLYLSAADICVAPEPSNPYNDRSTAIKVMEYMASCKPIVSFDLPEHRFSAQEAALYAQPNDELDYARKIATLMDDPEQRRHLGEVGRRRIETGLAWTFQERHLLEAYELITASQSEI
jgi:glycosyltransferase involved in cell wall biosynthesis